MIGIRRNIASRTTILFLIGMLVMLADQARSQETRDASSSNLIDRAVQGLKDRQRYQSSMTCTVTIDPFELKITGTFRNQRTLQYRKLEVPMLNYKDMMYRQGDQAAFRQVGSSSPSSSSSSDWTRIDPSKRKALSPQNVLGFLQGADTDVKVSRKDRVHEMTISADQQQLRSYLRHLLVHSSDAKPYGTLFKVKEGHTTIKMHTSNDLVNKISFELNMQGPAKKLLKEFVDKDRKWEHQPNSVPVVLKGNITIDASSGQGKVKLPDPVQSILSSKESGKK